MIQLRRRQPSLWHSGLAKDIADLWEPDFAIDRVSGFLGVVEGGAEVAILDFWTGGDDLPARAGVAAGVCAEHAGHFARDGASGDQFIAAGLGAVWFGGAGRDWRDHAGCGVFSGVWRSPAHDGDCEPNDFLFASGRGSDRDCAPAAGCVAAGAGTWGGRFAGAGIAGFCETNETNLKCYVSTLRFAKESSPVISTCERGKTRVESMLDTI